MTEYRPIYLDLFKNGELQIRSSRLLEGLKECRVCPHQCGVNRLENRSGFCRSGFEPLVSTVCAHRGEEPAISGSRGSGTLFFANCNMRCVYCQNYQISQSAVPADSSRIAISVLADKMLYLQDELGCHNINFVSPSHWVPQIVAALVLAVPRGLHLPLVYNTGGYDSLETLKALDGIVDIYLPDIRYSSDEIAFKYSGVKDYVKHNRAAIREMYRQVGDLWLDENEIARRGLIIRHLILPHGLAGSQASLRWIAGELSPEVFMSIMSQYYPAHNADCVAGLNRRISYAEYQAVVDLMQELGMENGWLQEMDAPDSYRPDFQKEGHPFE